MSDKLQTIRQSRERLKRELEAAGAKFVGSAVRCPFHDDHRPSAGIYQGKDGVFRFKCQASDCGFCGDIFDVRARITGRPLAEILLEAIGETESQQAPAKRYSSPASNEQSKVYPDFDSLRAALPGQIVSEHHYVNPVTGQDDLIVFRCQVNGEKSYRPAHRVKGGFVLAASPKPWPLYRLPEVEKSDTVVVCEGEKCGDLARGYGIVATTNAFGAGKAEHADWTPLAGKNVVLWPDNDVAGRNHMKQVQAILETIEPKPRVSWIEPGQLDLQEKEDLADIVSQLRTLEKNEAEITAELRKIIGKAKPLGPLDKLQQRIRAIATGEYRVVSWSWPMLGNLTQALLPGTVTLLAGTVGASKSFMLLQAVLYWLDQAERIAYYVLEGDRAFHLSRALAQLSEVGNLTDVEWVAENPLVAETLVKEHSKKLERFSGHLWASDNLGAETLEQLAEWIEAQAKLGRRLIAIDPITALSRMAKPWIADPAFLKSIRKTSTNYGCSVILVTHPTKDTLEPTLQNLAGSAAYQRFVDCIITLQNHEPKESRVKTACGSTDMEHNRTVGIEKARNGKGTGIRLAFEFSRDSLTLKELGIISKTEKR